MFKQNKTFLAIAQWFPPCCCGDHNRLKDKFRQNYLLALTLMESRGEVFTAHETFLELRGKTASQRPPQQVVEVDGDLF